MFQTFPADTRRLEAGRGTRLEIARVTSLREQRRAALPPLRAERGEVLFASPRSPAARPPNSPFGGRGPDHR